MKFALVVMLALQGCDQQRRCEGRECLELAAVAPSGVEALVLFDEGCAS